MTTALLANTWVQPFLRIRGVFRRHFFLWLRNPEYFLDTFWQPVIDVLIWGFVSKYLSQAGGKFGTLVSFFLGAIVLWAVLRRGQHEVTFTLMEEAWSRNLQNILMTPVGVGEYFAASILFGTVKLAVEMSIMGTMVFFLFQYNVLEIGWPLIPFAASLILTGWAIGLIVNGLIILFGRGLVALSWIVAFAIQPFACVFYPLSALPTWAQPIAKLFPGTWVFEGMRQVLSGGGFPGQALLMSFILNIGMIAISYAFFISVMKIALDRGLLTRLEW